MQDIGLIDVRHEVIIYLTHENKWNIALAFSENTDHEGMPVSNNLRLKYDYSFHEITAGHQYQLFKQSL